MAKSSNEGSNVNDGPNANEGNSKSSSNTAPNIRFDDFIRQVKPDPNSTDQIMLLHGYIGEGATEDKIRVYSDAGLAEYVEIAKQDVLYSLPNDNDPLGGSSLWVKQSNALSYNQGNMYNDYMQNQYTPGAEATRAGAQALTVNQPNCFIPASRVVRCPILTPLCPVHSRLIYTCLTRNNLISICHPCLPPTYTITYPTTPQIPGGGGGPGVMNEAYGAQTDPYAFGDYTQGDMYNNYMQNQYTSGAENVGAAITGNPNCAIIPSRIVICRTPFCPTRNFICFSRRISLCNFCPTPTYTITYPTTPQFPAGGAGAAGVNDPYGYGEGGAYGAYTGGEMYNDYMQNQYAPEAQTAAAAAPPIPPSINNLACRPTQYCPTSPIHPACRFTGILYTPCRHTGILYTPCRRTRLCTINVVQCNPHTAVCNVNPGAQDAGYDPYGYGY